MPSGLVDINISAQIVASNEQSKLAASLKLEKYTVKLGQDLREQLLGILKRSLRWSVCLLN